MASGMLSKVAAVLFLAYSTSLLAFIAFEMRWWGHSGSNRNTAAAPSARSAAAALATARPPNLKGTRSAPSAAAPAASSPASASDSSVNPAVAAPAYASAGGTNGPTNATTAPPPAAGAGPSPRVGRFPRFGTPGFARECGWTAAAAAPSPPHPSKECFVMVRPFPKSNEGLSLWTAVVGMGHAYSVQSGCRLLADYGPGVDVGRVLAPPSAAEGFPYLNWTVPDGFGSVVPLPQYRWAYHLAFSSVDIKNLTRILPGYKVETGMACSINRVFQLAPTASEFVPDLFTTILPTVMDEEALVMSLYIRTRWSDKMSRMEANGEAVTNDTTSIEKLSRGAPELVMQCALKLEQESLLGKVHSSVVWMVVTDSPNIGRHIVGMYHGQKITEANGTVLPTPVPRTVLTTASRGVQTRPKRGPSTQDFAEAMIDWYLIGESDLVISAGGLSFGTTGSLRTARPLYDPFQCRERDWIFD